MIGSSRTRRYGNAIDRDVVARGGRVRAVVARRRHTLAAAQAIAFELRRRRTSERPEGSERTEVPATGRRSAGGKGQTPEGLYARRGSRDGSCHDGAALQHLPASDLVSRSFGVFRHSFGPRSHGAPRRPLLASVGKPRGAGNTFHTALAVIKLRS